MRYLLVLIVIAIRSPAEAQTMSTAKHDVETLMNAFIGFGEQMLRENGEFFPYGAAMKRGGELVAVAGYEGDEHPPSQDVIDLLNEIFVKEAKSGEFKATALFYDVRIRRPNDGSSTDAIAVALDHEDDYSIVVFLPYRLQNGQVSFEEALAQPGANSIFANDP